MGLCHAAPLSHLACPVSAVDRAVLVCLHHPRHPPTPPAPGAVCEARRGGRALHDGPAAVGRWCWRGQCTWCVCAGARRAVVVAVLRAAGVVALAPPSVVTASHPAAIATATPEEQCGNPPPVPCTGTSHQQPPMHRCALCLRLRARGAAGGLRNRGRRHRLAARPAAIATEARQRARRHPPRLSPL